MFFALLPLPCLRGLKSLMSVITAALHRLPAMSKLLLVGKWFSDGFFGDRHRRPSCNNWNSWFAHAPGSTSNKISSGDAIATPLSSFQLGSIITGFPRGLRMEKSSAALLPRCKSAPRSPLRDLNTPWSAVSKLRDVKPPFQHRERCEPANFQK